MVFKSLNRAYTDRALRHFKAFIEDHSLFRKDQNLLIAVSGGVDSMVLGYMVYNLGKFGYSGRVRFIYVNHNTRQGQIDERDLVGAYAKHLGINFISKTLEGLDPNKNFEHQARMKRYKVIEDELLPGELLLLAHHIDDSYEWSILQGLRSSNLDSIIGIPLVNGLTRRPMMCLTKRHIETIAKYFDLPYIQDPTNELIKYERNFLRHKVIKSFSSRHPHFLKHYVNRHNELARRLGVHRKLNQKVSFKSYARDNAVELISISSELDMSGVEVLILDAVKKLNPNGRGSLNEQVKKVKQALKNNKYGPLSLPGGLKVYLNFNYILICNSRYKLPSNVSFQDYEFTYKEYTYFLKKSLPLFVELKIKDKNFIFPKRVHPLYKGLPDTLRLEKMRYLSALNLLRQWSKKKNQNKSLKLRIFLAS